MIFEVFSFRNVCYSILTKRRHIALCAHRAFLSEVFNVGLQITSQHICSWRPWRGR